LNRIVTVVIVVVVIAVIASGAFLIGGNFTNKNTSSTTTSQTSTRNTSSTSSTSSSFSSTTTSDQPLSCAGQSVTIGYFANVNHGQALIGLSNSSGAISFQSVLGPSCTIKTQLFTSGPSEMTALLANQIQIAFVGPDPAVSAYVNDNQALRIVSGVASGGALFVVTNASGITNATATGGIATLNGGTFGAPALGNTQDVALRTYISIHHVNGTTIDDTSDSNLVTLLVQNKISGAWLPQPYASLALSEASAHIFLDERSLWPGGNFSTAEMAVATSYLSAHADVVQKLVLADVQETVWINQHLAQAALDINSSIFQLSGLGLSQQVLNQSMSTLSFTYDPLISSVDQQAQNAYVLGFLGSSEPNLSGLFNLTYLNNALTQLGLPTVTS
jgi:NitT/TauT family transport system substrate-binding protein